MNLKVWKKLVLWVWQREMTRRVIAPEGVWKKWKYPWPNALLNRSPRICRKFVYQLEAKRFRLFHVIPSGSWKLNEKQSESCAVNGIAVASKISNSRLRSKIKGSKY